MNPQPTGARHVGVFGGAFDPPHRMHHTLATAALAQLRLDRLHVVPTGIAWHKNRAPSDGEHRLAMARLAFADIDSVFVDDRELRRDKPSYTIDTLRELASEYPGAQLALVIGEDQARALHSWHAWQDVLRIATVCVARRGASPDGPAAGPVAGSGVVPDTVAPAVSPAEFGLPPGTPGRFVSLRVAPSALSATQIRAHVRAGEDVAPLVGHAVARYIVCHRLYLST